MACSELRPDLRLVPTGEIRFHEHPESLRTERLKDRIETEGKLRNPPIVANMEDGHFLLLDGANRISSFRELGYPLVPVQVVDYYDPSVSLKGWHHLLVSGRALDLKATYGGIPGCRIEPVKRRQIRRLLELRQVFTVLVEGVNSHWGVFPDTSGPEIEIHRRIEVLNDLVDAYEGQTQLERIKLADFEQLPDAIRSVEHQICLFPLIHKEEILRLATEGVWIPTGLTRHVIPGRALGINLDLAFLRSDKPDEEKRLLFRTYIDELAIGGQIRYYEESVFLLNE